jgi:hypothetical protein
MNYSSCCSYKRRYLRAFAEISVPRTSLLQCYIIKNALPTLSAKATEAPPCKDPQADAQLVDRHSSYEKSFTSIDVFNFKVSIKVFFETSLQ